LRPKQLHRLLLPLGYTGIAAVAATALFFQPGAEFHFVDIAEAAGITGLPTAGNPGQKEFLFETTGSGAAIFDMDGDGRNDVLLVNGTRRGAAEHPLPMLYRNLGGGRFEDIAAKQWPKGGGWGQGVCIADYDNDGRPDVLITYYGVTRLYRNTASGFEDISAKAGLPVQAHRWGSGCAFVDYDRDGRVDIFLSHYADIDAGNPPKPGSTPDCFWKGTAVACGPKGLPMARNALYHQKADGTLEDVSEKAGILKPGGRYGLGVAAADFNNDGWPDIYVACDQTPSLLYENRGDGTFRERGLEAGVALNSDGRTQAGMGVAIADFDGNGFLDIAKTNFSGELPSLYLNEDGRFFEDIAGSAGLGANLLLGWGIAFADFDDDGWKDLLVVNGHVYPEVELARMGDRYRQKTLLYRNLGDKKFADVTVSSGPAFTPPRAARGLAIGDLDEDGRPEAIISNMSERPSVLKNTKTGGNFVNLELRGTHVNRSAIGARVRVRAGKRDQIDEVMSGGSYFSQHSLTLHFGLGAAKQADSATVRWPGGKVEEWKVLPVNAHCVLTEGQAKPACRMYP